MEDKKIWIQNNSEIKALNRKVEANSENIFIH